MKRTLARFVFLVTFIVVGDFSYVFSLETYDYPALVSPDENNVTTPDFDAVTAARQKENKKADAENVSACNLFGSGNLITCADSLLGWIVKVILINLAMGGFYIVAVIAQAAIVYGIVDFAKWAGPSLYPLWALTRDILSTASIFVGIYFIFFYIIGKGDKIMKFIPWLLIFALTVNFSYPVARGAIDLTNVVALSFYEAAVPGGLSQDIKDAPVGLTIANAMGLSFLPSSFLGKPDENNIAKNITGVAAALMLFFCIVYITYVLSMISILLMARLLGLIGSIIISPLLFVDIVVPKLGEYAASFRTFFFSQIFVAPVFMLLLYIGLRVIDGTKESLKVISPGSTSGSVDVRIFFGMLFVTGIFHIMLKVTKSLSGKLGEAATGFVNGAMGAVGVANPAAFAFKGAALAGRGVLGTAGRYASEKWGKGDSWTSEKINNLGKRMSTSTYDFRGTSAFKSVAQIGGVNAVSFGKPIESLVARGDRKEREVRDRYKELKSYKIERNEGEGDEEYEKRKAEFQQTKTKEYLARVAPAEGQRGIANKLGLIGVSEQTAITLRKEFDMDGKDSLSKELDELEGIEGSEFMLKLKQLKMKAGDRNGRLGKWFEGVSNSKLQNKLLDDLATKKPSGKEEIEAFIKSTKEIYGLDDIKDRKLIDLLESSAKERELKSKTLDIKLDKLRNLEQGEVDNIVGSPTTFDFSTFGSGKTTPSVSTPSPANTFVPPTNSQQAHPVYPSFGTMYQPTADKPVTTSPEQNAHSDKPADASTVKTNQTEQRAQDLNEHKDVNNSTAEKEVAP